jgi:F-type H+/Na+-transporting ATPase subunit alpha
LTPACAAGSSSCAYIYWEPEEKEVTADNGQISEVIKARLKDFEAQTVTADVGRVVSVGDGIAQIYGLQGVMAGELIEFPGGVYGLALNLEEDRVRAVVMGPYEHIKEGAEVRTTGRIVEVPVGVELLGRTVNALGQPIDGKGPVNASETSPIEKIAPRVITRQRVDTPVQTGIMIIDAIIPVGRGQRELILGDRQTGKTAILLDTIINQRGKGLFCVYCAIGQNAASIARVRATLEEHGAMDYTIIVAATASEPASLNYIVPYAACAMGEYFRDRGQDALVCYDDLGLPRAFSNPAPASRPGSLPRRRLLLAFPALGTRRPPQLRKWWWLLDRVASYRDSGRRYLGLHPH